VSYRSPKFINELAYGEYVYVPQPNGSSVTIFFLSISCVILLLQAHFWIFEKLRHVWTTSATTFMLESRDVRAKVVGVISLLHIMLWRSMSMQWSKCSMPIRSSEFDMSTPPYMPFLTRFKQWSWWNTASWTTYPPSSSGIGSVLLSIGLASSALILVMPKSYRPAHNWSMSSEGSPWNGDRSMPKALEKTTRSFSTAVNAGEYVRIRSRAVRENTTLHALMRFNANDRRNTIFFQFIRLKPRGSLRSCLVFEPSIYSALCPVEGIVSEPRFLRRTYWVSDMATSRYIKAG